MANIVVKYSLLSFPLASAGLGYWQIKRLEWKKGIIRDLEAQINQEPVDLKDKQTLSELQNEEYRRVRLYGQYDTNPENQILLRPRQLVMNKEAIARGRTDLQSNIGVCFVAPFNIDGSDMRILVNRGWLPSKGKDNVQEQYHRGLDSGGKPIELVGIVRTSDKRNTYGMQNNQASREWQIRDVDALAVKLNTEPFFIDAEADPKRTEGPIGGQTQLQVRNEHLNYAITWYSLAVFTFLMWYSKYGRRGLPFSKKIKK